MPKKKEWEGEKDSTEINALALHATEPGLVPDTTYGPVPGTAR